MFAKRTLLGTGLAVCLAQPLLSDEQWVSGYPGGLDLQLNQLYKIDTEGPNAIAQAPKIQEKGTAFAITPSMLITARHVTRNAQEFANLVAGGKIFIPDRVVSFEFAQDTKTKKTDSDTVASVTPAATPTIDAARLNLGRDQTVPFKLSVCPVNEGEQYYLLKFRDGKIDVPRVVPIVADVESYTDHGEARRFTHQAMALDKPKSGDSGSPILNEKGHVVGLLTAIQDTEETLYVTMTQSFMDLVPSGVNVECADRVNRGQFNRLNDTFAEFREQSQAERDDIRRSLEARLDELQGTFETTTSAMQTKINELETENQVLAGRLARASKAATVIINVLKEIEAQRGTDEQPGLGDMSDEFYNAVIQDLENQDPVIPVVQQMFKDLGLERWSFRAFKDEKNLLTIAASYERNISRPRFAEELTFCLRPMTEAKTAELQDDLEDKDNIYSRKFYRDTDRLAHREKGLTCRSAQHPLATSPERKTDEIDQATYPFKEGFYSFYPFDAEPPEYEQTPEFTNLFYGFMYIEDGSEDRNITHRFIFETDVEEDRKVVRCYLFEDSDANTFANFMQANQEVRESAQKCSDT